MDQSSLGVKRIILIPVNVQFTLTISNRSMRYCRDCLDKDGGARPDEPEGHEEEGDGYMDLVMHFSRQEVTDLTDSNEEDKVLLETLPDEQLDGRGWRYSVHLFRLDKNREEQSQEKVTTFHTPFFH